MSAGGQQKAAAAADEANVENKILTSQLLAAGTPELLRARAAALAQTGVARDDIYNTLVSGLQRTDPMYAEWDTAYSQGSDALGKALAEWDSKYGQVRTDEASYMKMGEDGIAGYTSLMEDPSSITSDPGYQFRLGQGSQALERSAAAKGQLFSGATGKAMTEYGQEYATSEYDKALARQLAAVNVGERSVGRVDQAGMQTASGKSSVYSNLASLAMARATGKTGLATNQSNTYQAAGQQWADLGKTNAALEQQSSQYLTDFWRKTMLGQQEDNSESAQQRGTAYANEANAYSKGIGGIGSAISGGLGQVAASNQQSGDLNNYWKNYYGG